MIYVHCCCSCKICSLCTCTFCTFCAPAARQTSHQTTTSIGSSVNHSVTGQQSQHSPNTPRSEDPHVIPVDALQEEERRRGRTVRFSSVLRRHTDGRTASSHFTEDHGSLPTETPQIQLTSSKESQFSATKSNVSSKESQIKAF